MTLSSVISFTGNDSERPLRTVAELQAAGLLASDDAPAIEEIAHRYSIALTTDMAEAIDPADPSDPIARQFIPDVRENDILPHEYGDPIGDYPHAPLKALVHRHANRVLLKPTMICPVYCRFCFRRDMVGPNGDTVTQQDVDLALDYIAQHDTITEVILTGGDPLVLSPPKLSRIMQRLHTMPHLKFIRIHTRVPVVQPDKITAALLQAVLGEKQVLLAVHSNHAREMTAKARQALKALSKAGIMLLGQTVLLKGVNNSIRALQELFETMIQNGIKPYYLHHPDLAKGTGHFRVSFEEGMALMNQVRQQVSGVCVPNYVIDIPGGYNKIPVTPEFITRDSVSKDYVIRDLEGRHHHYPAD